VEGNIISEKQLHFWHVYHTNALYDFRRVEIWCTSSVMDFCGAFLWHFGAVTPCYHSYSLYGKKKWLGYSSKILLLWSTGEKSSGFETT